MAVLLVPAAATASHTLLSTSTLSGTTTTISGINQSYKHLYFEVFGVTSNTSNGTYKIEFGSATSMSTYSSNSTWQSQTAPVAALGTGAEPLRSNANNFWQITIFNYADAATYKGFTCSGSYVDTTSTNRGYYLAGGSASNSAISSLIFTQGSGNSFLTGTVRIYGVN